MGAMIAGAAPPVAVFMVGRGARAGHQLSRHRMQRARVDAHASEALMMASILFAAGAFTGIMKESGMLTAMAKAVVTAVSGGYDAPLCRSRLG